MRPKAFTVVCFLVICSSQLAVFPAAEPAFSQTTDRVAVVILENLGDAQPGRTVENTIIRELMDLGYQVIDTAQAQKLRERN